MSDVEPPAPTTDEPQAVREYRLKLDAWYAAQRKADYARRREVIATAIAQGLAAGAPAAGMRTATTLVRGAVDAADALIKELDKKEKTE